MKQWEEDNFDEDKVLDRTGSIKKKHAETEAELVTYQQELAEAVAQRERAAARSETSDPDDFYVSDEDEFLDRTGSIEKGTILDALLKFT